MIYTTTPDKPLGYQIEHKNYLHQKKIIQELFPAEFANIGMADDVISHQFREVYKQGIQESRVHLFINKALEKAEFKGLTDDQLALLKANNSTGERHKDLCIIAGINKCLIEPIYGAYVRPRKQSEYYDEPNNVAIFQDHPQTKVVSVLRYKEGLIEDYFEEYPLYHWAYPLLCDYYHAKQLMIYVDEERRHQGLYDWDLFYKKYCGEHQKLYQYLMENDYRKLITIKAPIEQDAFKAHLTGFISDFNNHIDINHFMLIVLAVNPRERDIQLPKKKRDYQCI